MTKTSRIAITGPESTGKTTLARQLNLVTGASCVPEYAREYLMEYGPEYEQKDLVIIAKEQYRQVEEFASWEPQLLVADTEMTVMKIWQEVVYGEQNPVIEALWQKQEYDLYFLPHWKIPWKADPLRENPNDRKELFERYYAVLEQAGLPFEVLEGTEKNRLAEAIRILKARGLFPD